MTTPYVEVRAGRMLQFQRGHSSSEVPLNNSGIGTPYLRTSDLMYGLPADSADRAFAEVPPPRAVIKSEGEPVATIEGFVRGDGKSTIGVVCWAGEGLLNNHCVKVGNVDSSRLDLRFAQFAAFRDTNMQLLVAQSRGAISQSAGHALEEFTIPLPPVEEQRRIADFLDDQVAHIDALVSARREQRETLIARYDALIASEFSEGEPRPLKAWLRESPVYGVLVPRFVDNGVPMIRISDLDHLDNIAYPVATIAPAQSAEYGRTVTQTGDLLVSCVGSMGKAAIVTPDRAGSNVNRAIARLKPLSPEIGEALLHWVSTQDFLDQALLATGTGAAQPTLNMSDLKNFTIRMPDVATALPRLRMFDLDRRSAHLVVDENLRLLEERKRALITAAVTGELDVTTAKPIGMGKWVPNVGAGVEAPAAAQSSSIGGIG